MNNSRVRRALAFLAVAAFITGASASAWGQAWVPSVGTGSATIDYQKTHVNKHLFGEDMTAFGGDTSGRLDMGKIDAQSVQLAVDYGIARNFAFSGSVAYVGATYHGNVAEDPMDDGTFNGTLQDANLGLRYMVPWQGFAFTPQVAVAFPTHAYSHHGHTAVGQGNTSFNAGIAVGRTLAPWATNVWLQGVYTREFVRDVEQWGLDVNEFTGSLGWYPMPRLAVSGYYTNHHTQDGVDWFMDEFTSDVEMHHDQAARTIYQRVGGALGYQLNASTGLFLDIGGIVSGRNTHDGVNYSVGTSWNFLGPAIH